MYDRGCVPSLFQQLRRAEELEGKAKSMAQNAEQKTREAAELKEQVRKYSMPA